MEARKLSMEQAEAIRKAYRNGANQRWIAGKFNVSKQTIKLIVQNKTYRVDSEDSEASSLF
jgi:transposase